MNENIDLTKILKDCPAGTKLYSTIYGEVKFIRIVTNNEYKIILEGENGVVNSVTSNGKYRFEFDGECSLFPSKDQRDWSKFTAHWYKKKRFDPKTLNAFDKVIVRDACYMDWTCGFFSHTVVLDNMYKYNVAECLYRMCIPYNEETKHLVGTNDEAPEYYRYWED